jgi:hypothetical protein
MNVLSDMLKVCNGDLPLEVVIYGDEVVPHICEHEVQRFKQQLGSVSIKIAFIHVMKTINIHNLLHRVKTCLQVLL